MFIDIWNIMWNPLREQEIKSIIKRMSKKKEIYDKFKELSLKFIKAFEEWNIEELEYQEFSFDENRWTFTPLKDWRICKFSDEDIEILKEMWEIINDNDYYLPEYEGQTYIEWLKNKK